MHEGDNQVFLPGSLARGEPSFALAIGHRSAEIGILYERYNATSCVFLTAYNPDGATVDAITNLRMQSELFAHLAASGHTWFDGASQGANDSSLQSPSALIIGMTLEQAHLTASHFGQKSFVFAGEDCTPVVFQTANLATHGEPPVLNKALADFTSAASPRHDLLELAKSYGVDAKSVDALNRFINAATGSTARPDLVPSLFSSHWQRLGERLEHIYSAFPDEFCLEVGHRQETESELPQIFIPTTTFSLAEVRQRFERRQAPRTQ